MRLTARFLALPLLMLSAACSTVTLDRQDAECSGFIPESWKIPVPSAPLPAQGETDLDEAKAWQGFGVAQTGQLQKANGRTGDILHIWGECERRYNAAKPRKKWLGLF